MNDAEFNNLSVSKTLDLLKKKEIQPKDIISHSIEAIEKDNKNPSKLNAIIYHNKEHALKESNKDFSKTPLMGLPIVIKGNMNYKGFPISCSSKMLEDYISPYNASVIQNLLNNGAIIYGVSNMDEFAMGSSNETSAHGCVRNPINRDYVPGGSSGGATATVGSNQVVCALGSDTGGSIRQPASFCGVVGLKPTYGRVSRYGIVAFGSSFDQVGPITKTVEDSAILLKSMAGHDINDATTTKNKVDDYPSFLNNSIKGKKIALIKDSFESFVETDIQDAMSQITSFYKDQGCIIEEVDLPVYMDSLKCYYVLAVSEVTSNLSRFDSIRYGNRPSNETIDKVFEDSRSYLFGKEVKKRCILGNLFLQQENYEDYFMHATKGRRYITQLTNNVLNKYDAIISPTSPFNVFKFNQKFNSADPLDMYLSDIFTVHANITKIPSISIPCAKDINNMPISFQISGRLFDEKTILNLAHIYEINHSLHFDNEEVL